MNGTQIHDVPGRNDVSGKHDVDRGSPVCAEEIGRCSPDGNATAYKHRVSTASRIRPRFCLHTSKHKKMEKYPVKFKIHLTMTGAKIYRRKCISPCVT